MSEPIYRYYERELTFIRQMAQEFARARNRGPRQLGRRIRVEASCPSGFRETFR